MISPTPDRLALAGFDMESGAEVGVEMHLMPPGTTPLLLWPGEPLGKSPEQWAHLPRRDSRRTLLGGDSHWGVTRDVSKDQGNAFTSLPNAGKLGLTEHLMAAWLFFPRMPIAIHCPQGSLPLLDGSAKPYSESLSQLAVTAGYEADAPEEYESGLRFKWEWEGGFLWAEPSECFSATYEIIRGEYRARYSMSSASEAFEQVLPARTFIFSDDYIALRSQGRLIGANANAGLLLAESNAAAGRARQLLNDLVASENQEKGLLHPAQYRFPDEAARHKMLDLLGDLAIFGLRLPRLRLHLRNAGHHHHHRLLEALIHERAHP